MSDETISCSACNRKTPKNMYNKCVYCGAPYPQKHWFSDEQKAYKIAQLKEENEAARQRLEESRNKEKEQEEKRRRRDSSY